MTLSAPTEQDMMEWIKALRLHQIDLFRARSTVFETWLNKQGVKVPGAPSQAMKTELFVEDVVSEKEVNEVLMPETRVEE